MKFLQRSLSLQQCLGLSIPDRLYHAVPENGTTIEGGVGGLPLVRTFGLNTRQASNLAGMLVDTSGNVTVPGTQIVTGVQTFSAAPVFNGGITQPVVVMSAATKVPTVAQSGSLFLFNKVDGVAVTLPVPVAGLQYSFGVLLSVTSVGYTIDTDSESTFIIGGVNVVIDTSATTLAAAANGSSIDGLAMNGTTTGGLIGTYFTLTAINGTQWLIEGTVFGSGSIATPFTA